MFPRRELLGGSIVRKKKPLSTRQGRSHRTAGETKNYLKLWSKQVSTGIKWNKGLEKKNKTVTEEGENSMVPDKGSGSWRCADTLTSALTSHYPLDTLQANISGLDSKPTVLETSRLKVPLERIITVFPNEITEAKVPSGLSAEKQSKHLFDNTLSKLMVKKIDRT